MDSNPLFPATGAAPGSNTGGYVLPQHKPTVQPITSITEGANEAIELIRAKLEKIYADAPDPFAEAGEAEGIPLRSKHQQFMLQLSQSGQSPAEVQTAWNEYYKGLPDKDKHEVWQEFYAANSTAVQAKPPAQTVARQIVSPRPGYVHKPALSQAYLQPRPFMPKQHAGSNVVVSEPPRSLPSYPRQRMDKRAVADLRSTLQQRAGSDSRSRAKDHVHSLLFGVTVGLLTLFILLFSFFNETIIAPFIQPSRNVGATPIIVNPGDVTASSTPEVIIPKIHLEIPADYSQTSTNEATIETALENGIVHYPSTVLPGQTGNAAFFGHSSNNIFNPGKYKFAFVLLHEMQPGDTFYLTFNGKAYIYKVFDKRIVEPSDVSVLNNLPGHTATAMLITCDPPGTSLHRLIVVGDQISPDPAGEPSGSNTSISGNGTSNLPGNGPSLFSRLWDAIF